MQAKKTYFVNRKKILFSVFCQYINVLIKFKKKVLSSKSVLKYIFRNKNFNIQKCNISIVFIFSYFGLKIPTGCGGQNHNWRSHQVYGSKFKFLADVIRQNNTLILSMHYCAAERSRVKFNPLKERKQSPK